MKTNKKKSPKAGSTFSFEEGLAILSKEKPGFQKAFALEYEKLEKRKWPKR